MRDWWGALACFAIGLGVKEDLMTLPALLILHDLLLRREENWRATVAGIVRRLAPFIALLLVVLLAQWSVQRLTYMVGGGNYAPKFIPGNYAKMTVAQINPWWRQAPAKYLDLALYALVLTGLVRGDRRLRYFLLWIFVTYLPFALLDWGHEDRFFLIPSFGLGGLFGLAVERLLAHGRRRSVVLAALAVIALGFAGINRGPLTAWYTTEAWRTASFVKTVRKATRPGQHFQLVYDPVTNPETKFIDPTFVLPIEFGDGRHADRLPAPACDEKLVRLAWHGGGFRVMQPAAGKPDADVPGKSFPLR
ncbi:MAG TPA: hypothetical protein PKM88_11360 [bacterium]|nr:hypothetical protein [bacterium]